MNEPSLKEFVGVVEGLVGEEGRITGLLRMVYGGKLPGVVWGRLKGTILVKVLKDYLSRVLPEGLKLVEYGYLEGYPYEYDLLVVRREAESIPYTPIYRGSDVAGIIEVKYSGFFISRAEWGKVFSRFKARFEEPRRKYRHIDAIYIAYREAGSGRRGSIDYIKKTKDSLGSAAKSYFLQEHRTGKLREEDWKQLLNHVKRLEPPS